jgi:signal transduction histidine kinase
MLSESVRVYAILVRMNQMFRRERQNKLMNLEAAVAAVAHEVRQPLTGISANSSAARRYLGLMPPNIDRAQAILDEITSASLRADEVLKSVRALFQRTNPEQHPVQVNELIREAIQTMRREISRNGIIVNTQLAGELPLIMGDRGQLQEVLLNLIQNSIDAMRTVIDGSRIIRVATELQGTEAVVISMGDSGPGIDPKKVTSIFDAFVTTKATGMGLGLAISQMIIERHNGQIVVVPSATNKGAHFRIKLPIKNASPPKLAATHSSSGTGIGIP